MLNVATTEQIEKAVESLPRRVQIERDRLSTWLDERIAASKKKPSAEVVTITPVLAQLLLDRNTINRPISKTNTNALLSDIANERFEFNGESIVVSDTGILIDGQHRLMTIVETNRSIQTVIVFGPKESARYTIDIGRPKSASNFLAMRGHKNAATLAASARLILLYRGRGNIINPNAFTAFLAPTKTEVMAAVEQLRGLESSVEFVSSAPRSLGPKSILAFCHYTFWKRSARETSDYFFSKLMTGDGLGRGDAILYLRNRLQEMGSAGGSGANAIAELIFKCWNAHRRGETISKLPLNGRLPKVER